MKPAAATTVALIEAQRVVRWDAGGGQCFARPRPAGCDLREAVMTALESGCRGARVWVLSAGLYQQRLVVNAAQVAGLSAESLAQALSFEIEPFSGVPVRESAVGFREEGGGYAVVQARLGDVAAVDQAVRSRGGRLAGLALSPDGPNSDEPMDAWMARVAAELESGGRAFIPEPPRAPRVRPQWLAGAALLAVVACLLGGLWFSSVLRRGALTTQLDEAAAAARSVDQATRELTALRAEVEGMRKSAGRLAEVQARRGALAAVLKECASGLPQDTVLRSIEPDGVSRLKLSGAAMDAAAVDEFGVVLSQLLHPHGWSAQPRLKQARQAGRSAGAWDFVLELTHRETGAATSTPGATD